MREEEAREWTEATDMREQDHWDKYQYALGYLECLGKAKGLEEALKDVQVGLQMAKDCDGAWLESAQMDLDKALTKWEKRK